MDKFFAFKYLGWAFGLFFSEVVVKQAFSSKASLIVNLFHVLVKSVKELNNVLSSFSFGIKWRCLCLYIFRKAQAVTRKGKKARGPRVRKRKRLSPAKGQGLGGLVQPEAKGLRCSTGKSWRRCRRTRGCRKKILA